MHRKWIPELAAATSGSSYVVRVYGSRIEQLDGGVVLHIIMARLEGDWATLTRLIFTRGPSFTVDSGISLHSRRMHKTVKLLWNRRPLEGKMLHLLWLWGVDLLTHNSRLGILHADLKPANIMMRISTWERLRERARAVAAGSTGADTTLLGSQEPAAAQAPAAGAAAGSAEAEATGEASRTGSQEPAAAEEQADAIVAHGAAANTAADVPHLGSQEPATAEAATAAAAAAQLPGDLDENSLEVSGACVLWGSQVCAGCLCASWDLDHMHRLQAVLEMA